MTYADAYSIATWMSNNGGTVATVFAAMLMKSENCLSVGILCPTVSLAEIVAIASCFDRRWERINCDKLAKLFPKGT